MKCLVAFFAGLVLASPAHAYLKAGPVGYGHWLQGTTTQDGMATSLAAAYSFRKVRSAYAGNAVKLRRATGGTQDIGFTAAGDFDTAAAATFCSATTCFIETWYDQSAGARHLVQTTPANQPGLIFNCLGSLPCVDFGAAYTLEHTSSMTPVMPVTFSTVATRGTGGTALCYWARQQGAENWFGASNSAANQWLGAGSGSTFIAPAAADGAWHTGILTVNGASSVVRIDGTETVGSLTGSASVGWYMLIGAAGSGCRQSENLFWQGYALTADERTALANNQRDYWTPLPLDTFAAPAAAYSMRRLKSSYTGPAIRIRRSSDNAELDINFLGYTSFTGAPIDVAAAAAHCAATSCFGVTMYDQSGNARHATQATPANQPPLVFNCNGSLPCLRTTTTTQTLSTSPTSFTPATGNVSFTVVGQRTAGTGTCNFLRENGGAGGQRIGTGAANTWAVAGGTSGSIAPAAADNVWHTAISVVNGASSGVTMDGVLNLGTMTGSTVAGSMIFVLGGSATTCNHAESVVWDNYILMAGEIAALGANQKSFWGTP